MIQQISPFLVVPNRGVLNRGIPMGPMGISHLPTPEGWKAELALGGWLVTYRNKCSAPGIEPRHGRPSQY